jgi:hypothetical protein
VPVGVDGVVGDSHGSGSVGVVDSSGEVGLVDDGCGLVDDGCGLVDDGCGLVDDGCGLVDDGCGLVDDGCGLVDPEPPVSVEVGADDEAGVLLPGLAVGVWSTVSSARPGGVPTLAAGRSAPTFGKGPGRPGTTGTELWPLA